MEWNCLVPDCLVYGWFAYAGCLWNIILIYNLLYGIWFFHHGSLYQTYCYLIVRDLLILCSNVKLQHQYTRTERVPWYATTALRIRRTVKYLVYSTHLRSQPNNQCCFRRGMGEGFVFGWKQCWKTPPYNLFAKRSSRVSSWTLYGCPQGLMVKSWKPLSAGLWTVPGGWTIWSMLYFNHGPCDITAFYHTDGLDARELHSVTFESVSQLLGAWTHACACTKKWRLRCRHSNSLCHFLSGRGVVGHGIKKNVSAEAEETHHDKSTVQACKLSKRQ